MSHWIGKPKRLIVAAACRIKRHKPSEPTIEKVVPITYFLVFVGVRHFDKLMCEQMRAAGFDHTHVSEVEQGFVDNKGNFLNRKEAYEVAFNARQLNVHRKKEDHIGELFSEDLY